MVREDGGKKTRWVGGEKNNISADRDIIWKGVEGEVKCWRMEI